MIAFFTKHPTIANLLMIAFLAIGAVAAPTLQRETLPRVEANKLEISVLFPGAAPEDVEDGICQRIEDAVDSVDGVVEVICESREGQGKATVEMAEGGNLDRFFADVKTEIDAIDDFPDETEQPTIKQLGRTDFVAAVAVTGPKELTDLRVYA